MWVALGKEGTAWTLAKERLSAANLHCRCFELENEAREARERVASLEEKVNSLGDVLVRESQERSAIVGRYQGELTQIEALLVKQDDTLV